MTQGNVRRSMGSHASTTEPSKFRQDIQGLRGVAVLLVVVFHSGLPLTGGFVGVDAFFVVSGFVITQMILRELEEHGTLSLRSFYERRARRLLPAFALTSVVTMIATVLLLSPHGPQQFAARTGAAASLFAANLYLYRAGGGYFDPAENLNPFLHTWSLSVEEQFYLLMPVTILVAWKLGGRWGDRRRALSWVFIAVSSLSFLLSWAWSAELAAVAVPSSLRFAFYGPISRVWEFGVGVLLGIAGTRLRRLPPTLATFAGAVGAIGLLASAIAFDETTVFPGTAALLPVGATALLIVAGNTSRPTARALEWRPLVFLGDLSYGWYLWHWPAIVVARALWPDQDGPLAVAALASLTPAWLSYRFAEDPIRRNARLVGRRLLLMVTAMILVPVALGVAVQWGADNTWWILGPVERDAHEPTRSHRDGCASTARARGCSYPLADGTREVILVGDSHADALSDAVREAATAAGASFSVWSPGGCLFLSGSATSAPCRRWQVEALQWILTESPDVVVIAGYTTGRVSGTNSGAAAGFEVQDADGRVATSASEAVALYERGLDEAVSRLEAAGIGVVVVSTVPDFDRHPFLGWSLVRPTLTPEVVPIAQARRRAHPVITAERRIASRHPRVRVIDPLPRLCTDVCSQLRDGAWQYHDTDHLTRSGARRLVEPLAESIRELTAER